MWGLLDNAILIVGKGDILPDGEQANMKQVDGKVVCAGGILDEEGRMKGSLLVMDFDSQDKLDAYLRTEPYITEGVWEKVKVERMNVVIVNGEKVGM